MFHPLGDAKPLFRRLPAAALLLALGGCGGSFDSIGSTLVSGSTTKPAGLDAEQFAARPACPPIEVRPGGESLAVKDPAKPNDPQALRYQASIQRVARECSDGGGSIVARVGVAGRLAAGPKGGPGEVKVPIKITVELADKTLYSAVTVATARIAAPDFNALWSVIDEKVAIPADVSRDTTIFVQIDEGAKPAAAKGKRS
jgi:hypothetical protein